MTDEVETRVRIVNLKRVWITPDCTRLKPGNNPHNIPPDWKLPSDAEVIGFVEKPAPAQKKFKL